jgi:hypothetical protein
MKLKIISLITFIFLLTTFSEAQTNSPVIPRADPPTQESIEQLTKEVRGISKSLTTFNERLNTFLESLNKYKGIQLSERQQKLLFGYEILNQTEQLAATLRKSLLETGEKEATIRRRVAQIDAELRPENIERGVQFKGTTQTEENRESRRKILLDERGSLQNVLSEVIQSRTQLTENLKQTELFADSFRRSLFSQIRNEMNNF